MIIGINYIAGYKSLNSNPQQSVKPIATDGLHAMSQALGPKNQ